LLGSGEFQGLSFELDGEESGDSEQKMLESLLLDFYFKGFPYISIVDGGYQACHNMAITLACELENHAPNGCQICRAELSTKQKFKQIGNQVIGNLGSVLKFAGNSLLTWAAQRTKSRFEGFKRTAPAPVPARIEPDVFTFKCYKRIRHTSPAVSEPVVMTITPTELITSPPISTSKQWKQVAELQWLSKITSKRSCTKTLTFYFKQPDQDVVMSFTFSDPSEAKLCVKHVTARLTNHVNR
jgi:hypothetical protein